jgi:hypothetical protein
MRARKGILLSVVWALSTAGMAGAQSLGTTARQSPKGSLKILAYYQGVQEQELNFNISAPAICTSQAGGVSFACGQGGDVEVKGRGGAGMLKLAYQHTESLQYYAAFGVGDYSLSVPSATITNDLTGDNPGTVMTVGAKVLILPDTVVSPALALDASISRSRYRFNRRFPGGIPGADNNINQRLDLMQYQAAVEASHVFTLIDAVDKADEKAGLASMREAGIKLEPYGGVKWSRIQADLKDLVDGGHAGGQGDTVTPFVGLRLPVGQSNGLFAEASFLGGYQYAAGLEIRF